MNIMVCVLDDGYYSLSKACGIHTMLLIFYQYVYYYLHSQILKDIGT